MMNAMPTRLTQALATHTGIRQMELLHAANGAGYAANALIRERWNDLIALLQHPACRHLNCPTLAFHLRGILAAVQIHLRDTLVRFAHFGHDSAANVLVNTIPARTLVRGRTRFLEAGRSDPYKVSKEGGWVFLTDTGGQRHGPFASVSAANAWARQQRAVQSGAERRTVAPQPGLQFPPPPRPPREPVLSGSDDENRRRQLKQMLFPSPTEDRVAAILRRPVFGQTWEQELSQASKIAGFDADLMAQTISQSFALGKTPAEIAKDLRPAVAGVGSAARRIARTYGMQVSHAITRETHEQLGDLLVGYQVHAQFDINTRSWHADRSGTIYYANPEEGQKSYFQMPNPPLEADDPNERPAGAPHMAWN